MNTFIRFCIAPLYIHGEPDPMFRSPLPGPPDEEITLRIMDNRGRVMVDVMPDGRVELGDAYEPDATARRFWSEVLWYAERERWKDPR